jgi:hypothetical protein
MKKAAVLFLFVALAAFVIWFPFGLAYAVFLGICALILGAWSTNSGVVLAPWFMGVGFFLGFLGLISACVGLSPGAGTFVFGSEDPFIKLTLPSYGQGHAEFGAWVPLLLFVPSLLGAFLARGVNKRIKQRTLIPGTPNMPA